MNLKEIDKTCAAAGANHEIKGYLKLSNKMVINKYTIIIALKIVTLLSKFVIHLQCLKFSLIRWNTLTFNWLILSLFFLSFF